MRFPSFLVAVLVCCAAQAAPGDDSFQGALARGAAPYASQLSFVELYRLTLAGPATGLPAAPALDAPVRVSAWQAPAQFSVADTPKPQLWLLLLSGLAAAVWVARRRLGYGL
jgi:MYXO-CTERM domain-containing protein